MITIIVILIVFILGINIILFSIYFNWSSKSSKTKNIDNRLYYATTCENCGLEFDFGDYDIKMYIDPYRKQHRITQCPRCKTYINVNP
jgi:hypothetical protein